MAAVKEVAPLVRFVKLSDVIGPVATHRSSAAAVPAASWMCSKVERRSEPLPSCQLVIIQDFINRMKALSFGSGVVGIPL